jgi:hypothetical protein
VFPWSAKASAERHASGTRHAVRADVRTLLSIILTAASLSIGCAGATTPVAPTSPPAVSPASSVGLTVRVLTRATESPIAGANVFATDGMVGVTDATGELRTNVPLGVEFHIRVAAQGFVGLGAYGTVNGEERWTFYLEAGQ